MSPSRRLWLVSVVVGVGLGAFSLLADGIIGGRLFGILGNIASPWGLAAFFVGRLTTSPPGVIGRRKFIYDLWGDTVNIASRMESHGAAGEIQVTERVVAALDGDYVLEPRGMVEIKGKGPMPTWFLRGRRS